MTRGPVPKRNSLHQRRNRASTRATLPSPEQSAKRAVPPLPKRPETENWHPRVVEWWEAVWKSPMAAEYLGPDILGGLYDLAELRQRRWTEPDTKALTALSTEIRHQEVRFGLSPIDRRRLQWEVERGEQADDRTKSRRKRKDLKRNAKKDPRDLLKAVK